GGHVFYNSTLYVWGRSDAVKAFRFHQSRFDTNPVSQGSFSIPEGYSNEPAMSLSPNGTISGTGILWAAYSRTGPAAGKAYPGDNRSRGCGSDPHQRFAPDGCVSRNSLAFRLSDWTNRRQWGRKDRHFPR